MRISRIEISNHSRIRDLGIEVRGHAVIVGANDVGKSSILRLLNLLLGAATGQLYQQLSVADLSDPTTDLLVEVQFIDFTDGERTLFPREISVAENDKSESLRVQMVVAADPDDPEAVTIRRWFPEAGHERGPSREQLLSFGWRYLSATRGASAQSLEGPNSALQALLKAIDLGAEKAHLTGLLGDFNAQLGASGRITELRGDVAAHLSKAMPRSIAQDDLSVRTAADPEDGVLGNVSMFFELDGKHVPITEQSDGLRQLMSMTLFDLAEGTANVVAVDEPELHLHPASQRTVAELFGSSANQKLLVTHSPYIVQRFEPSQIIAVSPDGECHQIPTDKLSAVEKERANWWSPRLLEVLTARYAVIVEGPSDRIIVEAVARLMNVGLDRLGAVVFDLDGAMKFPHVYKLIGKAGFCVPILGLVDEAEKMGWHGAIAGKPTAVFGKSVWVSTPDLEAEYCAALTGPGAGRALIAAGFCKEPAILSSCAVTSLDDVTSGAVAEYCRKSKVEAAVAVASQLDLATAEKIASVHGLLQALQALGAS
ncbi:MAG TPA: AAA family ATPase [Candidatus Acidoferrum sp.]|jgi:putative ATP-dependent endonuclease of OLD family|nr:AAA family ATPase [Candidatus Acidoferrum sp.]